jgi:hypothetical protein
MKKLKMERYYTMNSWNLSTAPAFNLKVYNVIPRELQDKVFELMDCENFYDDINMLIRDFDINHNHKWQAGFNGRSGGYLVLYRGGKREGGTVFSFPGKHIETEEVPSEVLKDFKQLAKDIVSDTIYKAKNCQVETETYTVEK